MHQFYTLAFLLVVTIAQLQAQGLNRRALFLGNSYTYYNDLPRLVSDIATSMGDTLVYDSNAPGGYRFMQHLTNNVSLSKIRQGNWDYVVLQEQSQMPSFPLSQVEVEVFPYARSLDSLINAQNPCAETAFYMTWGRQNGDASNCANWPPICTYNGMDSLLAERYMTMTTDNNAIVSPVGAVWKHLRQNNPSINLYQSDQSHPLLAGSYAAACAFYTIFFRKDPSLITFSSTLPAADAAAIRTAVKTIVYDHLSDWKVGNYDPQAIANYSITNGNEVNFTNQSLRAERYLWNFGDGDTSTLASPRHVFRNSGAQTITLIARKCNQSDTMRIQLNTLVSGLTQETTPARFTVAPNPLQNGILQLLSSETIGKPYTLQLYNVLGALVHSSSIDSVAPQPIYLNHLPDGVYLASLKIEGAVIFTVKIVK